MVHSKSSMAAASQTTNNSSYQERAYTAASRRTDRSLEARMQSAQMASQIHKQRTGKSLRITEQAILSEEMYEEDDGIHAPSRATAAAQPSLAERRFSNEAIAAAHSAAPLASQSSDAWRNNAINTMFAQAYPNATSYGHGFGPAPMAAPQPVPSAPATQQQQQQQQQFAFPPGPPSLQPQDPGLMGLDAQTDVSLSPTNSDLDYPADAMMGFDPFTYSLGNEQAMDMDTISPLLLSSDMVGNPPGSMSFDASSDELFDTFLQPDAWAEGKMQTA